MSVVGRYTSLGMTDSETIDGAEAALAPQWKRKEPRIISPLAWRTRAGQLSVMLRLHSFASF